MTPVLLAHTTPTIATALAYQQQAVQADNTATQWRASRDAVVIQLHATDPRTWTVTALAQALALSTSTIRRILQ